MIDGPPTVTTPGFRLERLLEYQRRWQRSEWTEVKYLPFPILPRADGTESNENAVLTRGTVLCAFVHLGGYFRFFQLPSRVRGLEEKEWDMKLSKFLTLDIDFDPHQDLLVVFGTPEGNRDVTQLQVHSLSLFSPHPLASNPLLTSLIADQTITTVRIFGPYVTMFMKPAFNLGTRLSIFNWKTGKSIISLWKHSIESVTIISDRFALMVEFPTSNAPSSPRLWLVDIHRTNRPFVCVLLLPDAPRNDDAGISTREGHYVYVQSGPHSSDHSDSFPFFSTDCEERLVLVAFSLYGNEAFALFTLSSKLVRLAENYDAGGEPAFIPWEEWGPQNTRLMEMDPEAGENLRVHGTKAIVVKGDDQTLYDFNQRLIKRENKTESNGIVTDATELAGRISFADTVTTCLPYKSSRISHGVDDKLFVQMGEDGIVYLPTTFDRNIQICLI